MDRLSDRVEEHGPQPHQEGRAVDALVRLYRETGDEAALDLAGRMTRFALAHCFGPEGHILEAAGTHGHSLNAMVAGMLDYALVTRDTPLLLRVKAIYDVGSPSFNSSFGWSMESTDRPNCRGESNNTGDLLRAALLLGRAGFPECYGDAERILRGHLLPSQVLEVDDLPDEESAEDAISRRASRLRGGFSFPTPNDLLIEPTASLVTYDITSGAADGLCEAPWAAITRDDAAVWVNLLFSHEAEGVRVESHLSGDGRIEITNHTDRNVMLRLPAWVSRADAMLALSGREATCTFFGPYLLIPREQETVSATVTFPMCETRTVEQISDRSYTIDWRGDQIVAMSPPAEHRPMFPACDS